MIDNRGYLYPERKKTAMRILRLPSPSTAVAPSAVLPAIIYEDDQKDGRIISFYTSTTVPGITCFPMDGGP